MKFDLQNAIMKRGLVVDYNPRISTMLDRTGADVGSDMPIYETAEYMTFCSAKLSRQAMEANPLNIGFCPYVVFLYEAAGQRGVIVVGYRVPTATAKSSKATRAALAAVDRMLGEIIREAVK